MDPLFPPSKEWQVYNEKRQMHGNRMDPKTTAGRSATEGTGQQRVEPGGAGCRDRADVNLNLSSHENQFDLIMTINAG
jgi:hypothetical protein